MSAPSNPDAQPETHQPLDFLTHRQSLARNRIAHLRAVLAKTEQPEPTDPWADWSNQ